MRYFFTVFTHLTRNDPLITRLTQNEDDLDNDNGGGPRNDFFEPLNQNGEVDESFNPLSNRELSILGIQKADKGHIDDVCSICCDEIKEK